ncbi:hypothetical protein B4903_22010 [Yersinia frederiksenii]|nr:hypothetical protein B4903_22010 [Yersinia frederiksenii]
MLYKFFTVNENSLFALRNSSLWFSKVSEFNDPFEGGVQKKLKNLDNGTLVKIIKGINENGGINTHLGIKK